MVAAAGETHVAVHGQRFKDEFCCDFEQGGCSRKFSRQMLVAIVATACLIFVIGRSNKSNAGSPYKEFLVLPASKASTVSGGNNPGTVPPNLVSHSQYGQDTYIQRTYFPHQARGVFLESGAYDGKALSNSLMFEEIGWTGVLVEPLPSQFELVKVNRPHTTNVNMAFAPTRGTADFVSADESMISGIDEFVPGKHRERQKREFGEEKLETIQVPTIPVHELLQELEIKHVDFFSLDTEGSEIAILESVRWDVVNISVIMIETNFNEDHAKLKTVMGATGLYVKDQKYGQGQDEIWVHKEWLERHPEVKDAIGAT